MSQGGRSCAGFGRQGERSGSSVSFGGPQAGGGRENRTSLGYRNSPLSLCACLCVCDSKERRGKNDRSEERGGKRKNPRRHE